MEKTITAKNYEELRSKLIKEEFYQKRLKERSKVLVKLLRAKTDLNYSHLDLWHEWQSLRSSLKIMYGKHFVNGKPCISNLTGNSFITWHSTSPYTEEGNYLEFKVNIK